MNFGLIFNKFLSIWLIHGSTYTVVLFFLKRSLREREYCYRKTDLFRMGKAFNIEYGNIDFEKGNIKSMLTKIEKS